jgi:hypothetical protein
LFNVRDGGKYHSNTKQVNVFHLKAEHTTDIKLTSARSRRREILSALFQLLLSSEKSMTSYGKVGTSSCNASEPNYFSWKIQGILKSMQPNQLLTWL